MATRGPDKNQSLRILRDRGVPVGTVLDVGVCHCTAELMAVWPDRKHMLFEPVAEFAGKIAQNYRNIPHELHGVAVGDQAGSIGLKVASVLPGMAISHSGMTDAAPGGDPAIRTVPVRTIDRLLEDYLMPRPYLLKIDVDGVELLIMEGAKFALEHTNVVIVEAGLRNYFARASFLEANGFELFDIVDLCYYDDRLRQFDMVFVNSQMVAERGLDMKKQPFDRQKWVHYKWHTPASQTN